MTRQRSRPLPALLALAAAASGMLAPPASARIKVVYAGPPTRTLTGLSPTTDFNAFFRRTVTINTGDSVRWHFRGFHNVQFVPAGRPAPGFVVPNTGRPVSGRFDAAGAPFWFNGQPSLEIPPSVAGRAGPATLTGRALHNSGLPLSPRTPPYTLRFTRSGSFSYLCSVHPGMTGTVRVLPRGAPVPSALADLLARRAELLAAGRLALRLARFAPREYVAAGHDAGPVAHLRFFPPVKTVRAGRSVRFAMVSRSEVHTVTFGPLSLRRQLERDLVQVDPAAGGRPRRVTLNPLVFFPSDPPPSLPPYTGANHGNGFLNAGQLDTITETPFPPAATITFPTPGNFTYVCIIHPGMAGQIRVTA